MSKLCLRLKQFTDYEECVFYVQNSLVCYVHPKGGYKIVIPEDEELH